jgi:hypothetical protein
MRPKQRRRKKEKEKGQPNFNSQQSNLILCLIPSPSVPHTYPPTFLTSQYFSFYINYIFLKLLSVFFSVSATTPELFYTSPAFFF